MRTLIISIIICFPFCSWAQKGTIIPDVKPAAVNTDGIKTWQMESSLTNCIDSITACYLIKENGINKTVPQNDVYDFIFEPGYKYTLQVKEELKPPPVSAFSNIFNYTVIKIISKKQVPLDASSIPTVSKNEPEEPESNNTSTAVSDKKVYYTNPSTASASPELFDEVQALKKQVKDLKKQIETMQLQLDMQFQLFQNKK